MKKLLERNIIALSASIAVIAGSSVSYAIPADPKPKKFTQPDGTTVTVKIRGDERNHYYLTEDDYLLVRKNDAFYYGNVDNGAIVNSGILAAEETARSPKALAYLKKVDMTKVFDGLRANAQQHDAMRKAPALAPTTATGLPGLFDGVIFPSKGKQKVLVVLVDYKDTKFKLDDPQDYFSRMLMEEGFSDYGGTGSAYDYFKDNSRGQFDPQFDLYGPITMSHNMSYYGGNDWWGNDTHAYEMAIEACQQLDDTVDFSEYDCNGDGYIDNIYIFYAGRGEATGGSADTVWPHSWEISSATEQKYYFDGVRLERYGCSNEWEGTRPDGIGTFVHEFSHVLGLPDLYATSYTSAFTPGSWSALDYGPYNNDGCTPPNYGAFERAALGWLNPTVLDGPSSVTLNNITTNEAFIIRTNHDNEYFLFENRQQAGWDTYIPGHGMLVWHVDYNADVWSGNRVNNDSSHQYVDIEEADGSQSEGSRDGDSFPGSKGITSFTDDTRPSMRTWSKQPLGLPITNITETDGVIKFDVAGGRIELDPVVLNEATNIKGGSFDISWSECENAASYQVSVYTKTLSGDREMNVCVDGWSRQNVGLVNSVTVTGLTPETLYYCVVYAYNRGFSSDESNEVAVTTGAPSIEHITPVADEATEVQGDSFVANWQPVKDATCYYINVFTKGDFTTLSDTCDFTGGLSRLPQGWSTSSKLSFANDAYSGESKPALRLGTADAYLSSPVYTADVLSLKFWMRGSSASDKNTVRVYGRINSKNVLLAEYVMYNEEGGQTLSIPEMPEGVRAIRIEYHEVEHKGSVAIDDVVVEWNLHQPMEAVEGYSPFEAGDTLSCTVTGLNPMTTYYYTVVATDFELTSPVSNEVEVTTTEGSGIRDIDVTADFTIDSNIINISSTPDTHVAAYDLTGRMVAHSITDRAGHATFALSSKGVYVLKCGDKISKIIIK